MKQSILLPFMLLSMLIGDEASKIWAFSHHGVQHTKHGPTNRRRRFNSQLLNTRESSGLGEIHSLINFAQQTAMSLAIVFLCSQHIAVAAAPEAFVFNHEYADPLHPECKRKIQVSKDGQSFKYTGTAVGETSDLRGCTYAEIKKFGIRRETLEGRVLPGNQLDFGRGDQRRIGSWEPANNGPANVPYTDMDGIRWADNEKWVVKDKPLSTVIGEYIFLAYIGFSTLAGVKGVYDAVQRKKKESQA
jgi:hypothetical protein